MAITKSFKFWPFYFLIQNPRFKFCVQNEVENLQKQW